METVMPDNVLTKKEIYSNVQKIYTSMKSDNQMTI